MFEYDDEKLLTLAETTNTVIAALLPVLAIVVLYNVQSPAAKIGSVVGLTALFILALVITVKCRRIEVFAASAA